MPAAISRKQGDLFQWSAEGRELFVTDGDSSGKELLILIDEAGAAVLKFGELSQFSESNNF